MLDVALAAGVSRTTASYVLNRVDVAIPQETRDHVLSIAQQMGYRTNRLAKQLAKQRSAMIGLMVRQMADPFFGSLADCLNVSAKSFDYQPLFEIGCPDEEEGQRAIDHLLGWRVDGVILYIEQIQKLPQLALHLAGVPAVFIGPNDPGEVPQDCVYIDLYAGACEAANYLLSLGHTRFVYLGWRGANARFQAVADMLAERGMAPPPVILDSEVRETVCSLSRRSDGPTAIICVNDMVALAALRGIRDAGKRAPQDLSVVSCDENWVAEYMDPALSSVTIPQARLAQESVHLLHQRISGDTSAPYRVAVTPTLTIRESAAPPRKT